MLFSPPVPQPSTHPSNTPNPNILPVDAQVHNIMYGYHQATGRLIAPDKLSAALATSSPTDSADVWAARFAPLANSNDPNQMVQAAIGDTPYFAPLVKPPQVGELPSPIMSEADLYGAPAQALDFTKGGFDIVAQNRGRAGGRLIQTPNPDVAAKPLRAQSNLFGVLGHRAGWAQGKTPDYSQASVATTLSVLNPVGRPSTLAEMQNQGLAQSVVKSNITSLAKANGVDTTTNFDPETYYRKIVFGRSMAYYIYGDDKQRTEAAALIHQVVGGPYATDAGAAEGALTNYLKSGGDQNTVIKTIYDGFVAGRPAWQTADEASVDFYQRWHADKMPPDQAKSAEAKLNTGVTALKDIASWTQGELNKLPIIGGGTHVGTPTTVTETVSQPIGGGVTGVAPVTVTRQIAPNSQSLVDLVVPCVVGTNQVFNEVFGDVLHPINVQLLYAYAMGQYLVEHPNISGAKTVAAASIATLGGAYVGQNKGVSPGPFNKVLAPVEGLANRLTADTLGKVSGGIAQEMGGSGYDAWNVWKDKWMNKPENTDPVRALFTDIGGPLDPNRNPQLFALADFAYACGVLHSVDVFGRAGLGEAGKGLYKVGRTTFGSTVPAVTVEPDFSVTPGLRVRVTGPSADGVGVDAVPLGRTLEPPTKTVTPVVKPPTLIPETDLVSRAKSGELTTGDLKAMKASIEEDLGAAQGMKPARPTGTDSAQPVNYQDVAQMIRDRGGIAQTSDSYDNGISLAENQRAHGRLLAPKGKGEDISDLASSLAVDAPYLGIKTGDDLFNYIKENYGRAKTAKAPPTQGLEAELAAIDEALKCKKSGEEKTILFNCSGHGNFDMSAYDDYYAGKLVDYEYPDELIKEAIARIPIIS